MTSNSETSFSRVDQIREEIRQTREDQANKLAISERRRFWKIVYASAIRAGKSAIEARLNANMALDHLSEVK